MHIYGYVHIIHIHIGSLIFIRHFPQKSPIFSGRDPMWICMMCAYTNTHADEHAHTSTNTNTFTPVKVYKKTSGTRCLQHTATQGTKCCNKLQCTATQRILYAKNCSWHHILTHTYPHPHIYAHTHTYTCFHNTHCHPQIHGHLYPHAHRHIYILQVQRGRLSTHITHTHTHTRTHMDTYTYAHMHTYVHTWIHTHMHTYVLQAQGGRVSYTTPTLSEVLMWIQCTHM